MKSDQCVLFASFNRESHMFLNEEGRNFICTEGEDEIEKQHKDLTSF